MRAGFPKRRRATPGGACAYATHRERELRLKSARGCVYSPAQPGTRLHPDMSTPEKPIFTISVLVENKFGVLSRIAGLFSGRGYNIQALNVAPCEDPAYSRINIEVQEENEKLNHIIKQLDKLVNVVEVVDFRNVPTVYREVVLLRVRFGDKMHDIIDICNIFGAKVLDATHDTLSIECTGGVSRINRFLNLMADYQIDMLTRSGKIAVVKPKDRAPKPAAE